MLVLGFLQTIALYTSFSSGFLFDFLDKDTPSTGEIDQSDGTDVPARQPLLHATDWFLTEQEITQSRGGTLRRDLAVYTTGNAVTSLTVTKEFYNAVYDDLTQTRKGDRVLLSAFATSLIPLKPDVDPTGATTGLLQVFADAVNRGTNINILNWANYIYWQYNLKARKAINALPASPVNGAKAVLLFDCRVPHLFSAYHQKTLVLLADASSDNTDQPVAYVGGLDLVVDRWDTIDHNNSALRDASGTTFHYQGWIDGHVRMHGPAAKDVANNFVARWNSEDLPDGHGKLLNLRNPSFDDLPRVNYTSSNTTGSMGNQSIQITRTFSCKSKRYHEFAPRGEKSILYARIKAIKKAKNYMYIEDQYFIHVPELLDAIMHVMPTIQRLVVIANPQTNPLGNGGYIKYLYDMVSPIQEKFPHKFQIYTVKAELDLMIHTKVVIIDDVFLSVGSANWNRRSMTSDPELNAEIVDQDTVVSPEGVIVGKVPRDFRIRKFVEMTGRSYEALDAMTFIEAADQLASAATKASSLVEPLEVKHHVYFALYTDFVQQTSDPQDDCTDSSN